MNRQDRIWSWIKWSGRTLFVAGFFLMSGIWSMATDDQLKPVRYRVSESVEGMAGRVWDVQMSEGRAKLTIRENGRVRYSLYLDLDMEITAMATTKRSNGRWVDFWIPRDYVELELNHSDVPVGHILALVKGKQPEGTSVKLILEPVEVADE